MKLGEGKEWMDGWRRYFSSCTLEVDEETEQGSVRQLNKQGSPLLKRCMIPPDVSASKAAASRPKKTIQWDEENLKQTEAERPIRQHGVPRASDEPKTPYVKWIESESDEPSPMQLNEEQSVYSISTGGCGGGATTTTDEEDFIHRRKEHYKLPEKPKQINISEESE